MIAEVHDAIERYVDARDQRMAWGVDEAERKAELGAAMRNHGLTS